VKVSYFQQVPYRHMPADLGTRSESVVTVAYHDHVEPDRLHDAYRQALDELMLAARLGFDAVSVTEHGQCSYDMVPNPDLLASALAYATDAEGLEVAVYPVGRSLGKAREPLRVAEEYAMLDAMSGGRLVAGFPVGLAYDAHLNNGIPPVEIRARYAENLALVLKAWQAREPFAWNGRFSQHPLVNIWPRPIQQPHPPVWTTGIGTPGSMQNALSVGYGYNYMGWFGANVTGQRILGRFWDIAEALGVEPNPYRLGFMQAVGVAETDAEADELYGPHVEYFFHNCIGNIPMERMALPGNVPPEGLKVMLTDPGDFGVYPMMTQWSHAQFKEAGSIICGSPETVREQLADLTQRFRIGNLNCMLQFGSMPHDLARRNIELFAAEVMPGLKPLWADSGYEHHWWPTRLGGAPQALASGETVAAR
jgi:alkanesulfonate monooxygenase SsuD/methylene tetrahydromethanopterin reductase-like flavin-dependent oxidoreductase (luciferase family)